MKNQITSLGRPKGKTTQRATPTELLQAEQLIAKERVQSIPEIELLQSVPGIGPFLVVPELIPDMVYIYQLEGVQSAVQQMFPGSNPMHREIIEVFQRSTLSETARYIADTFIKLGGSPEITAELIWQVMNRDGIAKFASLIATSDPNKPESFIWLHQSQDSFKNIQKVEVELIKNEPDVVERTDIKCAGCKQTRIRTVPIQLKRADEASDYLATCVSCRRHWIVRS